MRSTLFMALTCIAAWAVSAGAAEKPVFPAIGAASANAKPGDKIQRTMKLLSSSTPERRNRVKILFYGQSITEQVWSKEVERDLRERFPHADLVVENRAIGGFGSQVLVRTAEHDLYPFQPDLLIFHVYGGNNEYEEIVRNVRARTTAEMLMQTDHVTAWPPENPAADKDKGAWWDSLMNNTLLPDIAEKHGCALVDVRRDWLSYLKSNKLQPKALLSDDVHLNDHGNFLLAEIVKRYLHYDEKLPAGVPDSAVQTLPIKKGDLQWQGNSLTVEFEGTRIDAIQTPGSAAGQTAEVLIDGRPPSEIAELYSIARPSVTQAGFWPGLLRVTWEQPAVEEKWTARILQTNDDASTFTFAVSGSKTGADGQGKNVEKFVSNSGRAVIEPTDWWLPKAQQFTGKKLTAGFEVTWQVSPQHLNKLITVNADDPSREHVQTLAQGLPAGKHRLELRVAGSRASAFPISALRVFCSPGK